MHWLGPYVIKQVMETGVAQLETLNGELLGGMVNGSRLKPYKEGDNLCNNVSCGRRHVP
jgi:hypothetical protein